MKPTNVDEYVASLSGWQADAASTLRRIVKDAAPTAVETLKWAQPVYEDPEYGPFCYFKAFKHHINLGFWWGVHMDDPHGILEGSGDKMRHIKIRGPEDINPSELGELVQVAQELNRTLGDPTRTSAS